MKERVVFETNVPVTATLAYGDGIKVQGRYGDQVMYSLSDERVMYVPPIVRDKLIELSIRQNEPFSICKAERPDGNRRFLEWAVRRIEVEQPGVATPVNRDNHGSAAASSTASSPRASASGNGTAKSNGRATGATKGSNGAQAKLRAALSASIDAAIEAERYASEHGLSIRFAGEDLRAMALSLFIDDEGATELATTGEALVTAYISKAACPIEPHAVEQSVEGKIAGVSVRGIVDVLDVNGRVLDFKTASKRPNGIPAEHGLQLTTYVMITPGASGSCRLDTVTKTKTVHVVQQTYDVGTEERHFAETLYPMVQDSIRDGIYPPHRSNPLCSRRHCGYWRECEREFGGRVPE